MKTVPFANALALTGAVLYLVCAIGILIVPGLTMGIIDSWFHGISVSTLPASEVTLPGILAGLVSFTVVSWLSGYLFAWVYKRFSLSKKEVIG